MGRRKGKKRKGKKTVDDLVRHARRRALERYGLWLEAGDIAEINRRIHSSDPSVVFHDRQSNTRTHFLMPIDDIQVRVVYNSKLKSIVTFLPLPRPEDERAGREYLLGITQPRWR